MECTEPTAGRRERRPLRRLSNRRHLIRHPPRGRSVDATCPHYWESFGITRFAVTTMKDPLRGDLIRRFAPPVRLAVPEKPFGLTLFLRFFDRCGNCVLAFSATCSARPQFPVRGEGFWRAGDDVGPYVSTAKRAEATNPPTSDGLLHAGCHLPLCRGGLGGWAIASSPTTAFEQTTPHPSFGEP